MKLKHFKLKLTTITTTLFVVGIIVSAGALCKHQENPAGIAIAQVCGSVGITFFAGLTAIHFTARSVRQTIVYLDKKHSAIKNDDAAMTSDIQLDVAPINAILDKGENISDDLIKEIARQLEAGQVALYVASESVLELETGFALRVDMPDSYTCNFGEGLVGRVAKEARSLYIDDVPSGYIRVFSGLGAASPTYLAIIPLQDEGETKGVLELALFRPLSPATIAELENIGKRWAQAGLKQTNAI